MSLRNLLLGLGMGWFILLGNVAEAQVNLINANGSSIVVSGQTSILLDGNWSNTGTFLPGSGTLVFNGSQDQTMAQSDLAGYQNITVHKLMGKLELLDSLQVNGVLTLNDGDFDLQNEILILGDHGLLVEDDINGGVVIGAAGAVLTIRELNAPAMTNPGQIGLRIESDLNLDSTEIRRTFEPVAIGTFIGISRILEARPKNNTGLDATLEFQYFDSELGANTEAKLRLFASYDNGLNWTLLPSNLAPLLNTLSVEGQDSLGRYTASSFCLETVVQTEALCNSSLEVYLDEFGNYQIPVVDLDSASIGACSIISRIASPAVLDCTTLGTNLVDLTVTGENLSTSTCTSTITVRDSFPPQAVCQTGTLYLDANGLVTPQGFEVDGGTTDNCSATLTIVNPLEYDCTDLGTAQMVTLLATDPAGNQNSCMANVNIVDTVAPVALCQDIVGSLSGLGRYKTKVNQLNNGSFDNCGIASITVDIPIFDCSSLGSNNQVVFTVTDHSGNQSTCTANVTIVDQVIPKIRCPLPITVIADPTTCTAPVNYLVRFIDNCPGAVLNQLEGLPSGSEFPVGTTVNNFEVVDAQGLSKTCSFTVTVLDPGGCAPQLPTTDAAMLFAAPSIEELDVFPNPSRGDFSISWVQFWEGETRLRLIDLNGQVVADRTEVDLLAGNHNIQWKIQRARLASGTYTLLLSGPQGQQAIQRIVIID